MGKSQPPEFNYGRDDLRSGNGSYLPDSSSLSASACACGTHANRCNAQAEPWASYTNAAVAIAFWKERGLRDTCRRHEDDLRHEADRFAVRVDLVEECNLALRQAIDAQYRVRAGQVVVVAGNEKRRVVHEDRPEDIVDP